MNEFAEHLRKVSHRLPLPDPARSRIILEIASDMDAMLRHHLDAGMDRNAARAAVMEQFELSDEALQELVGVHDSALRRSLDGLARQAGGRWERWVLAVLALLVAFLLAPLVLSPAILGDAGPMVSGIGAVLGVALGLLVWKGIELFAFHRGRIGEARRGLGVLPFLAVLLPLLGLAGVWVNLYRAALSMRAAPGQALVFLVHWLQAASATLVVALGGGLLVGLLWFFLEARATQLEAGAAASLLEQPSSVRS